MTPSATVVDYDPVKPKISPAHLEQSEDHDLVLRSFRVLIADLVQRYNGGHPG
jgi:dihydroxyacetone synthase